MRKYNLFILIVIICAGCKSFNPQSSYTIESGRFCFYYTKDKKIKDELILNDDSTFRLTLYDAGYKPSCTGIWKVIDKNTIRIECSPQFFGGSLNSANISKRTRELKIINNNKIKMPIENNVKRKYVTLERMEVETF